MTGPLRALGIALLCALGAGPAAADEHQMRWPWPGEWVGHTGPRLGVVVQSMSPELREYFGVDRSRGVLVARVKEQSPAAEAGIQAGDVILKADGEPVAQPHDLIRQLWRPQDAASVELLISRRGEERTIEVVPRPLQLRGRRDLVPLDLESLREQLHRLQERLEELEQQLRRERS